MITNVISKMASDEDTLDKNEIYPSPSLTRKLLMHRLQQNQRISNEAVNMANELLRIFIVEARERAAVEVR